MIGNNFIFAALGRQERETPSPDSPCRPVQKPGGGGIGIEVPKLTLSERSNRLSLKVHPRAPGKASAAGAVILGEIVDDDLGVGGFDRRAEGVDHLVHDGFPAL